MRLLTITLKVLLATSVYGVVHSALASRQAKGAAARWLGRRNRNGLYRVFYLAQSVVTLGGLAAYLWRVPAGPLLYHVRGLAAWPLHVGQGLALVYAVVAANVVGLPGILGLRPVLAWLTGQRHVPAEPEAQGPPLRPDGQLDVRGPFRYSRHPLNLVPVPILWLWPRMTFKLFVFSLASTVYLVLGSLHEEARLRAAYGPVYDAYTGSEVPFYLPRVVRRGALSWPRPERTS